MGDFGNTDGGEHRNHHEHEGDSEISQLGNRDLFRGIPHPIQRKVSDDAYRVTHPARTRKAEENACGGDYTDAYPKQLHRSPVSPAVQIRDRVNRHGHEVGSVHVCIFEKPFRAAPTKQHILERDQAKIRQAGNDRRYDAGKDIGLHENGNRTQAVVGYQAHEEDPRTEQIKGHEAVPDRPRLIAGAGRGNQVCRRDQTEQNHRQGMRIPERQSI